MKDSNNLRRRTVRLKGCDYSLPGGYFMTICTKNKEHMLGTIEGEKVILSPVGNIVSTRWQEISDHNHNLELDQWIIMPNHIHGIILLHDACRGEAFPDVVFILTRSSGNASPVRHPKGTPSRSLSSIIQNFKSISTRRVIQFQGTSGQSLWQRGYYDRIIRNEEELDRIRRYIEENPLKWELDPYHPTMAHRETTHSQDS